MGRMAKGFGVFSLVIILYFCDFCDKKPPSLLVEAFLCLLPRPLQEGDVTDFQFPRRFSSRNAVVFPFLAQLLKPRCSLLGWTPETHAPQSGCFDPLRLPLMDVFSFHLRKIGKNLQDEIRDQGSGQVVFVSCIQQRHIFLCQASTKKSM